MWKAKNASHIRTASTAAEYFNAKPKPTFTQKIGHYLGDSGDNHQRHRTWEKIRKQQFKIGNLPHRPVSAPDIWAAVLAA